MGNFLEVWVINYKNYEEFSLSMGNFKNIWGNLY